MAGSLAHIREVAGLSLSDLKALGTILEKHPSFPRAFNPLDEREFDRVVGDMESAVALLGFDVQVVRYIIGTIGSKRVKRQITYISEGEKRYSFKEWLDCLARRLFPASTYLDSLISMVMRTECEEASTCTTVVAALDEVFELIAKLCTRWSWSFPFGSHEIKLCILRKIPREVRKSVMRGQAWRALGYTSFVNLVLNEEASITEEQGITHATATLSLGDVIEGMVHVTDPKTTEAERRGKKAGRVMMVSTGTSPGPERVAPQEADDDDEDGGGVRVGAVRRWAKKPPYVPPPDNTALQAHAGVQAKPSRVQVCYNCNDPSHIARACPQPPHVCTRCQGSGHLEEHCWRFPMPRLELRQERKGDRVNLTIDASATSTRRAEEHVKQLEKAVRMQQEQTEAAKRRRQVMQDLRKKPEDKDEDDDDDPGAAEAKKAANARRATKGINPIQDDAEMTPAEGQPASAAEALKQALQTNKAPVPPANPPNPAAQNQGNVQPPIGPDLIEIDPPDSDQVGHDQVHPEQPPAKRLHTEQPAVHIPGQDHGTQAGPSGTSGGGAQGHVRANRPLPDTFGPSFELEVELPPLGQLPAVKVAGLYDPGAQCSVLSESLAESLDLEEYAVGSRTLDPPLTLEAYGGGLIKAGRLLMVPMRIGPEHTTAPIYVADTRDDTLAFGTSLVASIDADVNLHRGYLRIKGETIPLKRKDHPGTRVTLGGMTLLDTGGLMEIPPAAFFRGSRQP